VYPFERFSEDAKKVLTRAQGEAERAHHSYIGTEHLLLGLLQGDTEAARILVSLGVDDARARDQIERVLGRNERIVIQQIVPTSRVKKVIEISFEAARREESAMVTPEHLVIGLLEEGEGIAAHVLEEMGVTLEKFQGGRSGVPAEPTPWPPVGARVLVHDPEPPYRLWEGAVTGYEEGAVVVSVPGHPGAPEARVAAAELHVLPVARSTLDCARCRYAESRN
jgi:Clp amino terminal domain, pathogenicity island component